jgi:hypothetical protein
MTGYKMTKVDLIHIELMRKSTEEVFRGMVYDAGRIWLKATEFGCQNPVKMPDHMEKDDFDVIKQETETFILMPGYYR